MSKRNSLLGILLLLATAAFGQLAKTPLKIPERREPNLYHAGANAQHEVAESITVAGKQNKRVLLVFGANWCGDCYALDYAFHRPRIESLLNANFKVVHIDVGEFDQNLELVKKYHVDLQKGIPSLAVLTSTGGLLSSTAEFERARVMTEEDVIQFLNSWKGPPTGRK
jgi:thiol-disulfide isomerase/thioredoxin